VTDKLSFDGYLEAQQANLLQVRRLPHFKLVERLHVLYDLSTKMIPLTSPPHFGRLFLVCDSSLVSAAATIGRGLPADAGAVTRRAIEAACLARAIKHDRENVLRWTAYEQRMARWVARREGKKPPRLKDAGIKDPPKHRVVEMLRARVGALSDSFVHFTPEFYGSLDWRIEDPGGDANPFIRLQYFEPAQREIERALLDLAGTHTQILELFDECLGGAFRIQPRWRTLREQFIRLGGQLAESFRAEAEEAEEDDGTGGANGPTR
jgi:hypothetical protein